MPEQVTKHSPGPWRLERGHGAWMVMVGDAGEAVAAVFDHPDESVSDSDARLIAASPDLLSACESALPAIRWALTHQQGNYMQFDEVATLLEGAIARARGGSNG